MCQMACEVEVCDECSRICLLNHQGKHDSSPVVSSFFKIMFGKRFSEVLVLPPRFSRQFHALKGKNTYLENSTGQRCKVIVSDVEGSLTIQRGWDIFCMNHGIELGDLLVFYYIRGSHFIVQIYGRSGCEKTYPGKKIYQNKRPKTTRNSFTRKSPTNSSFCEEQELLQENDCFNAFAAPQTDIVTMPRQDGLYNVSKSSLVAENVQSQENKIASTQLVPVADPLMEPCFLIDKETSVAGEGGREHLFDLSAFELPNVKPISCREGDRDHLSYPSTSKTSNKKRDAGENHEEHLCALSYFELPGVKGDKDNPFDLSTSKMMNKKLDAGENHEERLYDSSTSKMTNTKIDSSHIDKDQLQGNTCSQVSSALQKAQIGDASIDNKNCQIPENTLAPSNKTEANMSRSGCSLSPISSPRLGMPLSSVMPRRIIKKTDTFEPSAASGYSQLAGETMRVVKQEPRESGQDIFSNVITDSSFGTNLSSVKEAKSEYISLNLKEEDVQVYKIVKSEPMDSSDSASAPAITIKCSVPPDNDTFLKLPEPLAVKGRNMKLKQMMVILRNSAGKEWPVVYHNKYNLNVLATGWNAFKKANNICPGDECTFVVVYSDKGIVCVQVRSS